MPVFRVPGVAAAFNPFDFYLGPSATDPTADLDGDPLVVGQTYWNTTTNRVRYYNGTAWVDQSVSGGTIGGSVVRANFNNATGSPVFQVEGQNFNAASIGIIRNGADASSPFLAFGKSRAAAVGGNTIVNNSDQVGTITFQGNDGTQFVEAAAVRAFVDGAPAANGMPGMLIFAVTPAGGAGAVEAMRISSTGNINVGGTPASAQSFRLGKVLTGSTGVNGFRADGTIQSDVTASAIIYASVPATQAATFTLSQLSHFRAVQGTFGAGSTVSEQNGFFADSSLIGATTNIGFRGSIPTGTNRWNLFMDGTAANYLNGSLLMGSLTTGLARFYCLDAGVASRFDGQTSALPVVQVVNATTTGDGAFIAFYTESSGSPTFRGSITYNRAGGVTAYNTTSDERLKKDITPAKSAGWLLDNINVISFKWKDSDIGVDYGFSAQQVYTVMPSVVSKPENEEEGTWQMDYSKLVPAMLKEIQELRKRVAELENK